MRSQIFAHKVGLGLRPPHYPYLETRPHTEVAWFEAISENYMDSRGRPLGMLSLIRQDYPVALHGVSMNIGSSEGVRTDYLNKLRDLIERIEPFLVSDHLCWTGSVSQNFHDLLPLPQTHECIQRIVDNIDFVQSYLRRPLTLENISSYVSFKNNEMSEWEFISEVARRSGCSLLLDLNNIHVNAFNHGFDPAEYLRAIPLEHVAQIHLGGATDHGRYLFDTHAEDIHEDVWNLFRSLAPSIRHVPVCIERDEDIPDFRELEEEVMKAVYILEKSHETQRSPIYV